MADSASSARTKNIAIAVVAVVLLVLAVVALQHALGENAVACARDALDAMPASRLALAVLLTIASYALLTAYDALALRYAGKEVGPFTVVVTSFIAFAFAHNVGFGFLAGTSVRARRYSKAGLNADDIARVAAFSGATTWLGIAVVGGAALLVSPPPDQAWLRIVGAGAVVAVAAYVFACSRGPRDVKLWRFTFAVPTMRLALVQLALAAADWLLAGCVVAALVAVDAQTFALALGAFAIGSTVAIVSHVPGGLGVLEGIVLALLSPRLPVDHVLGALVAFRVIYYVVPFVVALVAFAVVEVQSSTRGRLVVHAIRGTVPELSAVLVLVAGVVLLVSGSKPGLVDRMRALHHLVPLALIEGSHLIGSAIGIGLVILARGLWRRLDAAWLLGIGLLFAGAVSSLLKGFDWEEALILTAVAAVILPNRDKFYRTGSLFSEPWSPSFLIGVAAVVGATLYLGFLSYANVAYREQLWWQMALDADAPRFLRATVGVVAVVLAYGVSQLVRPTKLRKRVATDADVVAALAIASKSPESQARLVATGDKEVIFSDDKSAFLMYAVEGRAFIALGDPIGDPAKPEARGELIKRFRRMADEHDAACAFYQVLPGGITDYVDRGFALVKLGEEARVDLADFGLEGRAMKSLRASHKKAAKEVTFAVVTEAADVAALLPSLKRVSDTWLEAKHVREKGFSLGCFDDDYLKTGPIAVVKKGDDVVAFANIWPTDVKDELSIDLMRHDDRSPNGTMDFLFAELMLWGKAQGYRWFSLGMAPMSGLEDGPLSPWWSRAFSLIFRHGEALYNFKGLRAYKEKFDPVWRGRYLASASAVDVPRVLASVATLSSRGLRGVFAR